MKIAILEMGVLPETLAQKHGSFFDLIRTWLGNNEQDVALEYSQFVVCNGDALPAPSDFDAYVVSGSKFSVYEDLPWIHATKAFLNQVAALKIPMFGICFGHQLMAEAFGGKVEKSDKGWGVGIDCYQFADVAQDVLVYHQDQVMSLPESAQVRAHSGHCEYGVLEYDFPALSVQFHPEFTQGLVMDLLERSRSDFGEEAAARAEAKTQHADLHNQRIANHVVAFFQQHQTATSAV